MPVDTALLRTRARHRRERDGACAAHDPTTTRRGRSRARASWMRRHICVTLLLYLGASGLADDGAAWQWMHRGAVSWAQINKTSPGRHGRAVRRRRRRGAAAAPFDRERREHGRERDGAVRRADVAARLRKADGGVPVFRQDAVRERRRLHGRRDVRQPGCRAVDEARALLEEGAASSIDELDATAYPFRSPPTTAVPSFRWRKWTPLTASTTRPRIRAAPPVFGCVCARTPGDRFIGTGAPSAGMPTPAAKTTASACTSSPSTRTPLPPGRSPSTFAPQRNVAPAASAAFCSVATVAAGSARPSSGYQCQRPSLVWRPGSRAAASSAVNTSTA